MTREEFGKLRPGERLKDNFSEATGTVAEVLGGQIAFKWDDDPGPGRLIFDAGDAWLFKALVPKER